MNSNKRIAVVGLGSMGFGMATSLLRAGHEVYGVDINPQQVEKFRDVGGLSGDLSHISASLDIVVLVVLNAEQTEAALFGNEALVPQLPHGAAIVSCATVPPTFARSMAQRCTQYKVHYLDAPISGGSIKAAQGALSIMASGPHQAFEASRPALEAMAETVFELGEEIGTGSAMKSINQLLAGVHIAATAEAITFAMSQGVSPKTFMEVIPKCAGTSWMLENRAPHIVEGDYSPHSVVDIWLKDLGIVLDMAKEANFPVPLTATALQQFVSASSSGLGREDDAAVAKVYARNAGLKLPGED